MTTVLKHANLYKILDLVIEILNFKNVVIKCVLVGENSLKSEGLCPTIIGYGF